VLNSVNVNAAGLQALQAAAAADAAVQQSQQRIATGLAVASPKDDGATWAMAAKIHGQSSAWRTVDDSLQRGQSIAAVASAGTARVLDLLNELNEKMTALEDSGLTAVARRALQGDVGNIVQLIDTTALNAEFDGKKPLADQLTTQTQTTTVAGYTVQSSGQTPPSLAAPMLDTSGGASETVTRDGGTNAGRVDVYLQAYSMPDVLEIWQQGVRVAATGQAYAAGGGAVGAGSAVSGQNILSFDYDPLAGQSLEFRFNQGIDAAGSAWAIDGVDLEPTASTLPSTSTTMVTGSVQVSAATSYKFLRSPDGASEDLDAKPLTAHALGLDSIDWNDFAGSVGIVAQAISTVTDAAAYFGERETSLARALDQNRTTEDALDKGVSNLVDADLSRESSTLQAAQARKSLAGQALAIANAAPNWLINLFRRPQS
jgi:flagellin